MAKSLTLDRFKVQEFFLLKLLEFLEEPTMRYPNTIDRNIYLAYIRKDSVQRKSGQKLQTMNLNWDLNYPESLVEICIKTIAENWSSKSNNE